MFLVALVVVVVVVAVDVVVVVHNFYFSSFTPIFLLLLHSTNANFSLPIIQSGNFHVFARLALNALNFSQQFTPTFATFVAIF